MLFGLDGPPTLDVAHVDHWKAHGTPEGFDELGARENAAVLRGMQFMGADVPYPSYALRNVGARIRQAKARTQDIQARDETEPQELQGRGFRVFEERDENCLVIEFEKRQSPETCRMLHQTGFHWARSRGACSRQLTNAAWASPHYVIREIGGEFPSESGDREPGLTV